MDVKTPKAGRYGSESNSEEVRGVVFMSKIFCIFMLACSCVAGGVAGRRTLPDGSENTHTVLYLLS